MRKMILAATAALSLATGCGNPCDDLDEVCDKCTDPVKKTACELAVLADDGDSCEAAQESLGDDCEK